MKKLLLFSMIAVLPFSIQKINAQAVSDTLRLTFDEVIKTAEENSPNALIAKHRFRSSYWSYRTFLAEYRPSLTLTGTTPDLSRAYDKIWDSGLGEYKYVESNTISNLGTLALSQNIGLTGGSINLHSDLTRFDNLQKNTTEYITTPVSIGLTQPILRYNSLKWQKKIEPLRYAFAKKTFLASIETVHQTAVQQFFSLAQAQIGKKIAEMNYSNADTLYGIANGRYGLGTIALDELLQMQLSWLNAETARKEADMNLRDREIRLRSFLGYNENVRIVVIIPNQIPQLQVDAQEVLDLAMANNPDILNQQLTLLNAESSVAQAKAEKGLNANLTASYGLNQRNEDFSRAYRNPSQQERVRIGFTMPILDWGLGRGRYKLAQLSLELAQEQMRVALADFKQNLYLDVEQFNLQSAQVGIAAKSDTVATLMFNVTKQRFLIGRISVLELNNADTRKDQNRRAYIQSLQNYWNYFYGLRELTLFDFINRKPIETDYENLLK